MAHVEVLVEEPSAEAALQRVIPRILPSSSFLIHPFSDKRDLLNKLPQRLDGYSRWLPADWRIVVLLDRDRDDCRELKSQLDEWAAQRLLVTPSHAQRNRPANLVNRLAIEELEAWFFGDIEALRAAYPRVPANLGKRAPYRDPDAIAGGTWEALERVLRKAGYYPTGLPKIEVARRVSEYMDPDRNHSRSFQVFRDGLRRLVGA
ncbi:DUF4276 family protein [bacterium]|nr:DUF4276 family protein [bacterium]